MPRSTSIRLGKTALTGLNEVANASALGPGEAAVAVNVALEAGLFCGLAAPVAAGSGKIRDGHSTWTCNGPALVDEDYATYAVNVFLSNPITHTYAVGRPEVDVVVGGVATSYKLGVAAPPDGSASVASGETSSGATTYAITFYNSATDWESNPCEVGTADDYIGAVITLPTDGADDGVDKIRIYGTVRDAAADSTKYAVVNTDGDPVEVDYGDETWTDGLGYTISESLELSWGPGIVDDATGANLDNAEAPNLTCLANRLLPANNGGGILFGGVGNVLRWCRAGITGYWPELNEEPLDDDITDIIVRQTAAYVITKRSIYVVTGVQDEALTIFRTPSQFGSGYVSAGQYPGPTAFDTEHGVAFLSEKGPALFDGSNSRHLTDRRVSSTMHYSGLGTGTLMAYVDGCLVIYQGGGQEGYLLNFNVPGIGITALDDITGGTVGGIAVKDGVLYLGSNTSAKSWNPRGDGGLAWQWKTGLLDAGQPVRDKRFIRVWMTKGGTLSLDYYVDDQLLHAGANGSDWLPRGSKATGRAIQVDITGEAGSSLTALEIQCEVQDG